MKKQGYSAEEAVKAIRGSGGFVSVIAERLGCTRQTVYNLCERFATVAEALKDERESTKDEAESQLLNNIRKGDNTAIIFFLKTQAKDRGYIERQELTGKDGENLPATRIEIVNAPQPK